jgi:hypothetical protein
MQALLDEPEAATPKVYVAAVLSDVAAQLLFRLRGYPTDMIQLASIGDLNGVSEMDIMQTAEAVRWVTEREEAVTAAPKWQSTTRTTVGYETRVKFAGHGLHRLRERLEHALESHAAPYDSVTPWEPAMLTALTATDPEYDQPTSTACTVKALAVVAGDKIDTYPLNPAPAVTAAATNTNMVQTHLRKVLAQAVRLDERWLSQIEAIIEMAVNQAVEKIGRSIRNKQPDFVTASGQRSPKLLVMQADATDLEGINIQQLIQPTVDDATRQLRSLTANHIDAIENLIGDGLAVDITPKEYAVQVDEAIKLLRNRLKDWIRYVACTPTGEDKIENAAQVLSAPTDLVRDFAQVAGGDTASKNDNGVYQPDNESNGRVGLAAGAIGIGLLKRAFNKRMGVTERGIVERLEPGRQLPSALDEAFKGLARRSTPPVIGETYTWTPNYYGTIKTEHHPDHKPFFGTEVSDSADNDLGRRPGDHRHCKCGWDPSINLNG